MFSPKQILYKNRDFLIDKLPGNLLVAIFILVLSGILSWLAGEVYDLLVDHPKQISVDHLQSQIEQYFSHKYFKGESIKNHDDYYYKIKRIANENKIDETLLLKFFRNSRLNLNDLTRIVGGIIFSNEKLVATDFLRFETVDHHMVFEIMSFITSMFFFFFLSILLIVKIRQDQLLIYLPEKFSSDIKKSLINNKDMHEAIFFKYPKQYLDDIISEEKTIDRKESGGFIVWFNCKIDDYSRLSNEFLKKATHSVFSTTYSENFINALRLFEEDKSRIQEGQPRKNAESMRTWLNNVNNRVGGDFKVKRVQLLRKDDDWYNVKSEEAWIELMSEQGSRRGLLKEYEELYLGLGEEFAKSDNFCSFLHRLEDNDSIYFWGEYIIFDEMIMLKYSFTFEYLEIYFGKILKKYTDVFHKIPKEIPLNMNLDSLESAWKEEKSKVNKTWLK